MDDGEGYVLVWSTDGIFEGFSADGKPLYSKDRIVLVAPKQGASGFLK